MMIRLLLVLFLVTGISAQSAGAQWYEQGEDIPDTAWRKSKGSFATMMLLSSDPEGFLEQWNRPASPDYRPEMKTTDSARRGDVIVAFILFTGCHADAAGHCNTTADLVVHAPDGSEYANMADTEIWVGKPPPPEHILQLGVSYLGIIIEPKDLLGEYTVNAHICDHPGETCLDLSRSFQAIHRLPEYDLNALFHNYYLDPRPEYIGRAIKEWSISGTFENTNSVPAIIAFLSEVFMANQDRMPEWKAIIDQQPEAPRKVLLQVVEFAGKSGALEFDEPPSPSLNDMHWGAYFASGDTRHLDVIIENMRFTSNATDFNLFSTGASAKWSLSSNLRTHIRVRQHVEARLSDSDELIRTLLTEVLEKTPADITTEMVDFLTEQQEAGVW